MDNEVKGVESKNSGAAAVWHLIFRTSCPQSIFIPLTRRYNISDETIQTAIRMLAGGVGHTGNLPCGTVTGGSLALGAIIWSYLDDFDQNRRRETSIKVCGEYFKQIEDKFASAVCSDNVKTDFFSRVDLTKYFFYFRWLRCAKMAYFAAHAAESLLNKFIPSLKEGPFEPEIPDKTILSSSCALKVYRQTLPQSVSADFLRAASLGFDGGIGLSGRTCTALIAASLSIGYHQAAANSHSGFGVTGNIRDEFWPERIHVRTAEITDQFLRKFNSYDCAVLTERNFNSLKELTDHISSGKCNHIINKTSEIALEQIPDI